jgi:transposase
VVAERQNSDALNEQLTATIAELSRQIASMREEMTAQRIASATREAELLRQLEDLKKRLFGKKTEKMARPKDAIRKLDGTKADPKRRDEKRRENAEARLAMPTVIQPIPIPDSERTCPHCEDGAHLRPMGSGRETSEYEYVPGYFRRNVHVQEVLACTCGKHIVTAPAPTRVYDKCQYGPGFIAHLITSKCADSMPLYRLEKAYQRLGIPVSRSTMNELFHRGAEVLKPIYDRLLEIIRDEHVVLADETPLLMQKRAKRGYVWTFRSGKRIAYVFTKGRGGETPRRILGGTQGVLVVDAYTGYNSVLSVTGRQRAACLAHVRRKFFEALGTAPIEAQSALDLVLAIYRVEQTASERGIAGTVAHGALREAFGRPAMSRFLQFLRANRDVHPPRSPMGRAVRHAIRNWRAMTLYLRDPRIPVDNNQSESALRVVALGRKNFLFVGDLEGGENLAVLYSLVATCEANGINPHAYLADVLLRVQTHPASGIDELLPDRWAPFAA